MRALTLSQSWATLVAIGAKRIETRSWSTHYRGPLAIHASARIPKYAQELCEQEPFASALRDVLLADGELPLGCVIATCELVECFQIPSERKRFPIREMEYFNSGVWLPPEEPELSFGDYTPGRFAFILNNVRALEFPITARGSLGLWQWKPPKEFEFYSTK